VGYHLYCIVPAGHRPPPGTTGVDGQPVMLLEAGRVAAWVGELPERPRPSLERARLHNEVVEKALSAEVAPLPARFGGWFAGEPDVVSALASRESEHLDALARVAGAAEFGVRIALPESGTARDVQTPAHSGGRAYLEEVAQRLSRARESAERLAPGVGAVQAAVRDLVRAEVVEEPRAGLAGVLHLVPREHWDEYRRRVGRLPRELPALRFLISGPWPPYSFVA
jgi:hypothetical protein